MVASPASIGERIVFSFKGNTLPGHMKNWLRNGLCGGIVFFNDNFESVEQFKSLIKEIDNFSLIKPPLLMIDHEGGRVQRIKGPLFPLPAAKFLAQRSQENPEFIPRLGERVGKNLRRLGLNINIAPVLDVLTEPLNRVIGDRAFGDSPPVVSRIGIEFARGLLKGRICPVAKHFPGHGMTREDSHELLPVVELERNELSKIHIAPFIDAVQHGLPAVMTAHVLYRTLDKDLPATLSKKIIRDLLRGDIGFHGVVISDDLEMKAISTVFSAQDIVRLSKESTTDILIHSGTRESQEELLESLSSFYSRKSQSDPDLEEIHSRVGRFRKYIAALTSP